MVRGFHRRITTYIDIKSGRELVWLKAMILHAMRANGFGELYSIDLPLERDGLLPEMRGGLVPESLRNRWNLILGDSRSELPKLLGDLNQIDAFNHDSVHTTSFMTWEYETAWPYIRPGGFLSSHDIFMSRAWERFCSRHAQEIDFSGSVYVFGVARKRM